MRRTLERNHIRIITNKSHVLRKQYKDDKRNLKEHLETNKPIFEEVVFGASKNEIRFMQSFYNKSKNLKEFIVTLHKESDCNVFLNWLPNLIKPIMFNFINVIWEIKFDRSISGLSIKKICK